MDFTEIYKQSSSLVEFSPGAHFILSAVQDRVIIRHTDTLQIARTWQIDDTLSPTQSIVASPKSKHSRSPTASWISHIGWSCDSEYVLAACAKRGAVHIFKPRDEQWNGRIDSGVEGLVKAEWAPDGRNILCFSQWGLRLTVWSLVTNAATYIQFPVHPERGYAFRSDGRYFVVAERHKSKETLGVYDASNSYELIRATKHFPLPTSSLHSLSLSPNGQHIAVWEGPSEYKLVALALTGNILGTFSPDPDPGFGIRCVAWHPSSTFLAVGGWDGKINILDSLSWSPVATLEVASKVPAGIAIWREPSKWLEATEGRGFLSYERLQGSQTITFAKGDVSKANPRSGTAQLEWNSIGNFLLARFDNTPTAIHIFEFPSPTEHFLPKLRTILLHTLPVLHARWNPVRKGKMALCCGGQSIYLWSDEWVSEGGENEEMAECVGVPARKFETHDVKWTPDGQGLALLDKEQFCCAFEVDPEENLKERETD